MLKKKIMRGFILSLIVTFFVIDQEHISATNHIDQPELSLHILYAGQGPVLYGTISKLTPDMQSIEVLYSLDNQEFYPIHENNLFDLDFTDDRPNEPYGERFPCGNMGTKVVSEYVAGHIDAFYVVLRITTDTETYMSNVAKLEREAEQPLPNNIKMDVRADKCLRPGQGEECEYNITVVQGMTKKDVLSYLPSVLPIEAQLRDENGQFLSTTKVDFLVEWNIPNIIINKSESLEGTIKSLKSPDQFVVKTLTNTYRVSTPISLNIPFKLNLNMYDSNQLKMSKVYQIGMQETGLLLDFPLKPTGAKEINISYSLDGGATWIYDKNVLLANTGLENYPKNKYYSHIPLFEVNEAPYAQYINQDIEGFLIRVGIVGGVLDGQREDVYWPVDYEYEPPIKDNGDDGSGGNRGDVGSDSGSLGGSSQSGGQRPSISQSDNQGTELSDTKKPTSLDLSNSLANNKIEMLLNKVTDNQETITYSQLKSQIEIKDKHQKAASSHLNNQNLKMTMFVVIGMFIIMGIYKLFVYFKHS